MTRLNRSQRRGEAIIRERRIAAPLGHVLCDREPFAVQLHACRTVILTGDEVARAVGLPRPVVPAEMAEAGELTGAVVLAPCHVHVEVSGLSWPSMPKLYAWREGHVRFVEGDTVRLYGVRDGLLVLWAMVRAELRSVQPDASARGLWNLTL